MPRTTQNSQCAGLLHSRQSTPNFLSVSNPELQSAPSTPQFMSAQPESAHGSNQGQTLDESPDDTPIQPTSEEAFVKAVDSIVKANMPSKVKLWEPDPFDGSNSRKLRTFILQCKLNFRDCLDLFKDDSTKVNYILPYLKGSTLDCFEPMLLDPVKPTWLSYFPLFIQEVQELEDNFGSYNPVGKAEAKLEGLHMQEDHQGNEIHH